MKTKSKQSKILIVFATILCCIISLNSFSQNGPAVVVPDVRDFEGTWVGTNTDGRTVTLTLSAPSNCSLLIDGVPFNSNANNHSASNNIVSYRLPEYSPKYVADHGLPTTNAITIRLYTQNGKSNITAPAPSNTVSNNGSLVVSTVEQIYTGIAVIVVNANPRTMDLYIDLNNFSSTRPAVDITSQDGNSIHYCSLVKQ